MASTTTRPAGDSTQRELHYRKKLVEIANAINSAASIHDILTDIKDKRELTPELTAKIDAALGDFAKMFAA